MTDPRVFPIVGTVRSKELSPKKGLRAQDYLIAPKEQARELVKQWCKDTSLHRLVNPNGQTIKKLVISISLAIEKAYKQGRGDDSG